MFTRRFLSALLVVAAFVLAMPTAPSQAAAIAHLQLQVIDQSGAIVHAASGQQRQSIDLTNGTYDFQLTSDLGVARMRMEARNNSCPLGRIPDVENGDNPFSDTDDDQNRRIRSGTMTASGQDMVCDIVFNTWYENHIWAGHLFVELRFTKATSEPTPDPQDPPAEQHRYDVTAGTTRSAPMDTNTRQEIEAAHGVRVYCPVSHFSYDDPIVSPGDTGAAHLHMFWGNTSTDAFSTAESLLAAPASSCEGGQNNRSAYWMPALFNDAGEVMLPEAAITYYKSFRNNESFVRQTIQPIPNGLQMIADHDVDNTGRWNLDHHRAKVRGVDVVRFHIAFPQCIAVDAAGEPVLSHPDNEHVIYAKASYRTANNCPLSHPYRIPQVIYNVRFALDPDEGWSLSSKHMDDQRLHADYIAAWDVESMNRITDCNVRTLFNCQFRDSAGQLRTQLPERFLASDGTPVYTASDQLHPDTDRTPFGNSLPPGLRPMDHMDG